MLQFRSQQMGVFIQFHHQVLQFNCCNTIYTTLGVFLKSMVKSWSCVRFQARCEAVVRREAEVGAAEIHDGKRVTTNDESVETPGKTG